MTRSKSGTIWEVDCSVEMQEALVAEERIQWRWSSYWTPDISLTVPVTLNMFIQFMCKVSSARYLEAFIPFLQISLLALPEGKTKEFPGTQKPRRKVSSYSIQRSIPKEISNLFLKKERKNPPKYKGFLAWMPRPRFLWSKNGIIMKSSSVSFPMLWGTRAALSTSLHWR